LPELWPAKARLKEKPLAARRDCRLGHGRRFRLAALAVPVAVIVSLLGASGERVDGQPAGGSRSWRPVRSTSAARRRALYISPAGISFPVASTKLTYFKLAAPWKSDAGQFRASFS
jgi:hypothetical protein